MHYGFYLPSWPDRDARRHSRTGERRRAAGLALGDDRGRHPPPGRKPVHLLIHIGWQAPERRRCAGDFLDPRGGRRRDGTAVVRHLRAGVALPQSGSDRKVGASLDVLSGARLTLLGVGTRWLKEEFEALNSPASNARGAVT